MKITGIRSLVVNARMRNWIFVQVITDQDGLAGWGEATLEWKTRGVVGAIDIQGVDPQGIGQAMAMRQRHQAIESRRGDRRQHQHGNACRAGALDDCIAVGVELRRVEVAVAVDPGHRNNDPMPSTRARSVVLFCPP